MAGWNLRSGGVPHVYGRFSLPLLKSRGMVDWLTSAMAALPGAPDHVLGSFPLLQDKLTALERVTSCLEAAGHSNDLARPGLAAIAHPL